MRFADLGESFHTIVELLVSYLICTDTDNAIFLRTLFLVNQASMWIVYDALRAVKATDIEDMGRTFCRLSRCCELCGCVPEPIPVRVRLWDHTVGEHVDDVLLCGRCSDRNTVVLERTMDGSGEFVYLNRWSTPIASATSVTLRLDERLLDPTSGVAGVETFVYSLGDKSLVTLLLSSTPEHRFLTRRLGYCDARPAIDAFQPELDRMDAERCAAESAFVHDQYNTFRDRLASRGVDFVLDPLLTVDEVKESEFVAPSKASRAGLARMINFHMKQSHPIPFEAIYQPLCDRLCRYAVHESFGWVDLHPAESQLDVCHQILNGGCVRLCRVATSTWKAMRGGYPITESVSVGVEFSFENCTRQQFLIHSDPDTVDALGDCCASSAWRPVPAEALFALENLLDECRWHRPVDGLVPDMLHASVTPGHKRHRLPRRCMHVPPPGGKRAWWRLTSCSVCGGGTSSM
jgi:hypothetical protein